MSLEIDVAIKLLKHFNETEEACAVAHLAMLRSPHYNARAYDGVLQARSSNAHTLGYCGASIGRAIQDAGGMAGRW
jgi:hypothetical protein